MLPSLEEVDLQVEAGRLGYRLLVAVVVIAAVVFGLEFVAVDSLEQLPFVAVVEAFAVEEQFAALEEGLPFGFVVLEIGCNPTPEIQKILIFNLK